MAFEKLKGGNPISGIIKTINDNFDQVPEVVQVTGSSTASVMSQKAVTNAFKTQISEAYLNYGGKNIMNGFSPVDAALISALSANRFALMPADAIAVEYTRDGGATWSDYGASAEDKINLFTSRHSSGFVIGKGDNIIYKGASTENALNYKLRITIDNSKSNLYANIWKYAIWCATNGNTQCALSIDKTIGAQTTWVNVVDKQEMRGWTGWNIINTPNTQYSTDATSKIRFTFESLSSTIVRESRGFSIFRLYAFGDANGSTPSTMADIGVPYNVYYNGAIRFQGAVCDKNGNPYALRSELSGMGADTVGSETQPIYLNSGVPTICRQKIPSIMLNGSDVTSTAFYAPTISGSSGQFLKSAGAGTSPKWSNLASTYNKNTSATGTSYVVLPISYVTSYGLLIQWGRTTSSGSCTDKTISLSKAYDSTTAYTVICQPSNGTGTNSRSIGGDDNNLVHTKTTSSFKVRNDGGNFSYIDWVAIGWCTWS